MQQNQILAALQIENNEIRLVVGEFYHDCFYIIAKESVACKGTNGIRIVDSQKVIEAIKKAIDSVSVKLKTPLKNVILCIPGYRYKLESYSFDKALDQGYVTQEDIKQIKKSGYHLVFGNDYEIINSICASYKINGICYPKMPINEKGNMLTCDIDFICGDKMTMYDYVNVVTNAGLQVIDIVQDGYGASKEAALFEQSYNCFTVNIYIEASHCVFNLIYNGRIVAGFSNTMGYDSLIEPIMKKYELSYKDSLNLLFRYGSICQQSSDSRVINRWNDNGKEYSISYDDIQKCIYEASEHLVQEICDYCQEIVKKPNVSIVVSGVGAALNNLDAVLSEKLNCKVNCYCPDTLGVREYKWSALLGIFYVYHDNLFDNQIVDCVDIQAYKQNLISLPRQKEEDVSSRLRSITGKLFEG